MSAVEIKIIIVKLNYFKESKEYFVDFKKKTKKLLRSLNNDVILLSVATTKQLNKKGNSKKY